jgi:hypothetical protein
MQLFENLENIGKEYERKEQNGQINLQSIKEFDKIGLEDPNLTKRIIEARLKLRLLDDSIPNQEEMLKLKNLIIFRIDKIKSLSTKCEQRIIIELVILEQLFCKKLIAQKMRDKQLIEDLQNLNICARMRDLIDNVPMGNNLLLEFKKAYTQAKIIINELSEKSNNETEELLRANLNIKSGDKATKFAEEGNSNNFDEATKFADEEGMKKLAINYSLTNNLISSLKQDICTVYAQIENFIKDAHKSNS